MSSDLGHTPSKLESQGGSACSQVITGCRACRQAPWQSVTARRDKFVILTSNTPGFSPGSKYRCSWKDRGSRPVLAKSVDIRSIGCVKYDDLWSPAGAVFDPVSG